MRDALLPCIGSVILLFCWFVWSFIPKSSCTCLDELPGHNKGIPQRHWLEMSGSRFNIALGMASQNLIAKVVQILKEKQIRPPVLWACWSRSVCVSYSCSSSFLCLKSLTGEQGMHVSFYTVLWGFHNPVWPYSSAFIMSLIDIRTLSFWSVSTTFPQIPLSFPIWKSYSVKENLTKTFTFTLRSKLLLSGHGKKDQRPDSKLNVTFICHSVRVPKVLENLDLSANFFFFKSFSLRFPLLLYFFQLCSDKKKKKNHQLSEMKKSWKIMKMYLSKV